ncbi:MAG: hypothetical protein A4E19_19940 [Nitrospira sp. SG-bin1]|nr:MAG: hypothetical protein A4E19_19940 [Nitrospira sp. SG-bin1]
MTRRSRVARFWLYGIAAVVLFAMLPPVGMADDGFDVSTNRLGRQSDLQREQGLQKLMGTIKKTEKVGAEDRDQQNLIVQLKTQKQEKTITVDLGNVEQLKDMDIQVGNRIIVWGRLVIDGDNHLFRAHRLWIAGGTIDIERPEMSNRRAGGLRSSVESRQNRIVEESEDNDRKR